MEKFQGKRKVEGRKPQIEGNSRKGSSLEAMYTAARWFAKQAVTGSGDRVLTVGALGGEEVSPGVWSS